MVNLEKSIKLNDFPFNVAHKNSAIHFTLLKTLDEITTWLSYNQGIQEVNPITNCLLNSIGCFNCSLVHLLVVYLIISFMKWTYDHSLVDGRQVSVICFNLGVLWYLFVPLWNYFCIVPVLSF